MVRNARGLSPYLLRLLLLLRIILIASWSPIISLLLRRQDQSRMHPLCSSPLPPAQGHTGAFSPAFLLSGTGKARTRGAPQHASQVGPQSIRSLTRLVAPLAYWPIVWQLDAPAGWLHPKWLPGCRQLTKRSRPQSNCAATIA